MPEGQQLVEIEAQRQADLPARGELAAGIHQCAQLLLLVGIEVERVLLLTAGDGPVAAVAADVAAACAEIADAQPAAVLAACAARLRDLAGEGFKRLRVKV